MYQSQHFDKYNLINGVWDEMYNENSIVRDHYKKVIEYLAQESPDDLNKKEELAKRLFMTQGITFTVYNSGEGIEKFSLFDIIPRIITPPSGNSWSGALNSALPRLIFSLRISTTTSSLLKTALCR
jgi:uncharacterized circularly permuted ATP-grasp superfamily protein